MTAIKTEKDGRSVYRSEKRKGEIVRLAVIAFLSGFSTAYVLLHIFMF